MFLNYNLIDDQFESNEHDKAACTLGKREFTSEPNYSYTEKNHGYLQSSEDPYPGQNLESG